MPPANAIPPTPYNPFNPFKQYGFNSNNYNGPKNNFFRDHWQNKDFKKEVKGQMVGFANGYSEQFNTINDNNFYASIPNSQYDVFNKTNNCITKSPFIFLMTILEPFVLGMELLLQEELQ